MKVRNAILIIVLLGLAAAGTVIISDPQDPREDPNSDAPSRLDNRLTDGGESSTPTGNQQTPIETAPFDDLEQTESTPDSEEADGSPPPPSSRDRFTRAYLDLLETGYPQGTAKDMIAYLGVDLASDLARARKEDRIVDREMLRAAWNDFMKRVNEDLLAIQRDAVRIAKRDLANNAPEAQRALVPSTYTPEPGVVYFNSQGKVVAVTANYSEEYAELHRQTSQRVANASHEMQALVRTLIRP